eukprot:gene16927-22418_t
MSYHDERSTINSNRDDRFFTPRSTRTTGSNSSSDEWISPRQGAVSDNEFITPRDFIQSERSNRQNYHIPQPNDFGYQRGPGGMAKASSYNNVHFNQLDDHSNIDEGEIELIFRHARHGRVSDVEIMLNGGVPVDVRDEFGNTLLITAGQNGNKRVAKLLLKRGADINARNYKGNTPLHYCYHYNYGDTLGEYLISKGADDSIRNNSGKLPKAGI